MDLFLEIKLMDREPLSVLGQRGMASAERFEDRYKALYRKAFQQRLKVVGAPMDIFHNDHFDGQICDLESVLPVDGTGEGVKEIPGGVYACVSHTGPHGVLPVIHALIGVWLEKNGYHVCGAPYHLYVRGGNDKILPPEQYITEICYPVEKFATFDTELDG